MTKLDQIDKNKVPKHIAIIMDGNGRWAKEKLKPRIFGHQQGAKAVKSTIIGARKAGVKYLSLYAFSTENWHRPKDEVSGLMDLLVKSIENELDELHENGVKINVIGDIERLSKKVQNKLNFAITKTENNKDLTLIIALSYSSRWEIINAVRHISEDCVKGKILSENINEELFKSYLGTAQIPDPELLIRTSGEKRISNFLLYQLAYTELYFTDIYWPDFTKETLFEAILSFQTRERRFGKTSEQIK
ncbi:MAG: isoprenyl transferase [Bacteroidales bacterium]|nr:isoprenyl transferase [Bacteroidales bacterium]